jgi:hypothetical protein
MFRKMSVLFVGVLALSALTVSGASATTTPPTGNLNCYPTPTMTFKPALPPAGSPSTKNITVQIKKASLVNCDSHLVSGGKYAITGGTIDFKARIPKGNDCASVLFGGPIDKSVVVVKLTGENAKGHTATVAVVKPTNLNVSLSTAAFIIDGTVPQTPAGNKPFGGEHFHLELSVNVVDTLACTGGSAPLDHLDLSSIIGLAIYS